MQRGVGLRKLLLGAARGTSIAGSTSGAADNWCRAKCRTSQLRSSTVGRVGHRGTAKNSAVPGISLTKKGPNHVRGRLKMDCRALGRKLNLAGLALLIPFLAGRALADDVIKGQVLGGGAPVAKSTVTLWEASTGAPKQLAQTKTDSDGRFEVRGKAGGETILYLIAAGGEANASHPSPVDGSR